LGVNGVRHVCLGRLPARDHIFVFLIQHAAEIFVTFRLREQKAPDGIDRVFTFLPSNNSRNLRITYSLIIVSGMTAGFMSAWWRQGWMWTALGVMIGIWIFMNRAGGKYLDAIDAITAEALKNKDEPSAIEEFSSALRARRKPEIMTVTSVIGLLIILWLMMFKPF
jgi:hypothetical protein